MTSQSSSSTKWGIAPALVNIAFPEPGLRLGAYTLIERAPDHPIAERWIASLDSDDGNERRALLYRIATQARAAQPAPLDDPHILRADATTLTAGPGRWFCAPYPGRMGTIFVLSKVMQRREAGGCRPVEAALLAQHLLRASAHAHRAGACHGKLTGDEVLLSPTGTAMIELYGLKRRLTGGAGFDETAASIEVASVAHLACSLAPTDEHGNAAKPLCDWAQSVGDLAQRGGVEAQHALDTLQSLMKLPA